MLQDAFAQLAAGWIEMLPEIAHGSEAWPKPHALHVRLNLDTLLSQYRLQYRS
jgi:hypothetical protein